MKREERNQISRQRILESAAKEFAEKGYGLSSINVICAEGDISKGILYHYFKDKDELYLTCIQDCFDGLTAYLKLALSKAEASVQAQLDQYFAARWDYFNTRISFDYSVRHFYQLRRICAQRSLKYVLNLIDITLRSWIRFWASLRCGRIFLVRK